MSADIRIDPSGVTVSPSESERLAAIERRQTAHTIGLVALGVLGAGGLALVAYWTQRNAGADFVILTNSIGRVRSGARRSVPGFSEAWNETAEAYPRPELVGDVFGRRLWTAANAGEAIPERLARLLQR